MSPALRAATWMLGTVASFSAMAVAGREVSFQLDTFEIMMYRSVIGAALVLGWIAVTRQWGQVRFDNLRLHGVRNLAHFTGQNLWFYALASVPLAQVFALEFTSPIWVILLSPLILREAITRARLVAAFAGFVGILIVARPEVGGALGWGTAAAASCAIFFALTNLFTRKLTRSDPVVSIMFHLTLMQLALGLLCAGIDGRIAVPTMGNLPWLMLIGAAGLTAHLCLTNALRLAPAAVVVPVDFLRLPVIALLGMWLYAEPLDGLVFLGAAIIFAGNYGNILAERRTERATAPADVTKM